MFTRWNLVRLSVLMALVTLILASPASASVSVSPAEAQRGARTELTFRVTNDRQSSTVTGFGLTFPAEANIAFNPESEGWNFSSDDRSVTWSANPDAAVPVNQSKTFRVTVESMPELDSLSIPVTQTYADGTVDTFDGQQGIAPMLALTATSTTTPPSASKDVERRLSELEANQSGADDDAEGAWGFFAFVLAVVALVKIYRLKRRLREQELRA